jgi:large conductance mechanosensitive channel
VKGFKNFLMQGDLIVIAVGLVIALAFSTLIKSFTDSIITPLVNAAEGGRGLRRGWVGQSTDKESFSVTSFRRSFTSSFSWSLSISYWWCPIGRT